MRGGIVDRVLDAVTVLLAVSTAGLYLVALSSLVVVW